MSAHVLVVEDDEQWRTTLVEVLRNEGYYVTDVGDGEAAISLLHDESPERRPINIIVSDIVMGDIDGVEVTSVARCHTDDPEVILLTGYGSLESSIDALRAGAFDYLLKPCDTSHLLERIADALSHHLSRRRLLKQARVLEHMQDIPEDQEQEPTEKEEGTQKNPAFAPMSVITIGQLSIDTRTSQLWFDQHPVQITSKEYDVLMCLAQSNGQIIPYEDMVQCVNQEMSVETDIHDFLRQQIGSLSRKTDRRYFVNVYGLGYMLADPDA